MNLGLTPTTLQKTLYNNLPKGKSKITATSSKLPMPSSFSYKSITCDTKNNLQCFQSTTKPILPNLDTPLSQNLYNKLRKGLCRTTTHLSPPSHSDLGTEEALLQKTRLSHLFFPSWGECSFTLFICTIYPPIVFQLYIPNSPISMVLHFVSFKRLFVVPILLDTIH